MGSEPRTIYKITSPVDGLIYYVGETERYRTRQVEHKFEALRENRTDNNPLYPWLESIYKAGYMPVYDILETGVPRKMRFKVECDYITKFLKEGQPLLNRVNNAAKKYMDCSLFSQPAINGLRV